MDKLVIRLLIKQLIICSIFIILVFLFVKIYYSVLSEKRISSFAMDNKNNDEISIVDIIIRFIKKIINFFAKILKKSSLLRKYSDFLSKYLIYINTKIEGMSLIAIKFIIMILMQIIYIFTVLIDSNNFNIMTFLLISIVSFLFIDLLILIVYRNQRKLIEEQLLQAIVIMNSAFKSGKNITEAIMIVKKELPSPIKDEFDIIYKDISYGLSLEDSFSRFYNRVKLEEAKYIMASLSLLSKTGGNIVTVFNMIEKNFYNRLKIRNELGSLTASSKFLYRMLAVMPFIFIFVIVALSPDYFVPFYSSKIGVVLMMIMIFLYIVYLLVIRRIMKVDEV